MLRDDLQEEEQQQTGLLVLNEALKFPVEFQGLTNPVGNVTEMSQR